MPHNVHLFPFEGTTLHSIRGFLLDYVILVVVGSKAGKQKCFGSKQGQCYSKPQGMKCPAGAARFTPAEPGFMPWLLWGHSCSVLSDYKGSSHTAQPPARGAIEQKLLTYLDLTRLSRFSAKIGHSGLLGSPLCTWGKGDKWQTYACGSQRLILRHQISPANAARDPRSDNMKVISTVMGAWVLLGHNGSR